MLTTRDLQRLRRERENEKKVDHEPVVDKVESLDRGKPVETPDKEVKENRGSRNGLQERFRAEKGPNYNNRMQAHQRIRALTSAMRSNNLFDLFHKDALAECPRVWIIGGAPSAADFDYSVLENEVVIAINRNFALDCATSVLFMDKPFVRWVLDKELPPNGELLYKLWKRFKGPKIAVVPPGAAICQNDDDPYYVVEHNVRDKQAREPEPWQCLSGCNNSGLSAIKLAWGMGAKEIHLVGFQLDKEPDNKQKWGHAGYPQVKSCDSYKAMLERFKDNVDLLKESGVKVINHSDSGALSYFERQEQPKAAVGFKKPLVVGFYTIDTPYEEEIKGMEQSFRFFGFDVHTAGVPSRKSWTENCYYKPTFIREMMEAHPDRQIIWADADSRLRRYPTELFQMLEENKTFSIAAPFTDWAKVNPKVKTRGNNMRPQLSSAFMVMNNTDAAYKMVCTWERDCKDMLMKVANGTARKTPVDDIILEEIYYRTRKTHKKWVALPTAYGQIFDLAASAGVPVVEQMQASRRNRQIINEDTRNAVFTEDEFLAASEMELYKTLWSTGEYIDSESTKVFQKNWEKFIGELESVLEIGCGSGTLMSLMRNKGMVVKGYDLTIEGVLKYSPDLIDVTSVGPSWILPYADDSVDHIVSIDVLEHVPAIKVQETIEEMFRVARHRMTHIIATFGEKRNGTVVHKTVQPIEWWREMFESCRPFGNKCEVSIMDRKAFLKEFR